MEVNGRTRLCGLIGNPVEHTKSPLIHNTLAEKMNINMTYVPFHVEADGLGAAVKGAFELNVLGMNVTVPYKNEVIQHLAEVDELAGKIGAVNTLVRTDNGYKGYNTDITGLYRAMKSDRISLEDEKIIILGAGGVGRAVAFMCASNNAEKIYLLNRSVEKAEAVAEEVNSAFNTDCIVAMPMDDYKLLLNGNREYLVIQSTSVGLHPNADDVVIADERFYRSVKAGYDLIYTPWETKFMKLARANGADAFNGLKMLLYQGIDAFEKWNNCTVSEDMAELVYRKLSEGIV